jgi:hypothetical protein
MAFTVKNVLKYPITIYGTVIQPNEKLDLLTVSDINTIKTSLLTGELYDFIMGRALTIWAPYDEVPVLGLSTSEYSRLEHSGFFKGFLSLEDLKPAFRFNDDGYLLTNSNVSLGDVTIDLTNVETKLDTIIATLNTDTSLVQILAPTLLSADPTPTTTTDAAVSNKKRISFVISYAKHASATDGYAVFNLNWKFGAVVDNVSEPIIDGSSLVVNLSTGKVSSYISKIELPHGNSSNPTVNSYYTFEVPPVATDCRLYLMESGDLTNRGTVTVWYSTSAVL